MALGMCESGVGQVGVVGHSEKMRAEIGKKFNRAIKYNRIRYMSLSYR